MPIIHLGDIPVDVTLKDIKNIHLSVYPPTGTVRISAPRDMAVDTVRVFAISKLDWIRKQQRKLREQARETARDYIDRESHYLWGKRYLLETIEKDEAPCVTLKHKRILLQVRPGADLEKKRTVLDEWYRQQIKMAIRPLIQTWEKRLGVAVNGFLVRHMKTRWGTCTPGHKTIRLNLELAKKPPQCLEYIVVHELLHLIEPTHNDRFVGLLDMHIPKWRFHREALNQLPVRHEEWTY